MKVLLIEDDQRVSRFVERGLSELGFHVDVAGDGRSGLKRALGEKQQVVVLDLLLPEMDGNAVLCELRRHDLRLPVLVLSSRDDVGDRVRALDEGADDYLVKPFSFDELVARLRALVRRAQALGSGLEAADLHLDPCTRRVERAGRAISLTRQEFALLEYMLRHRDTVLTRRMIAEHVWGYHYDSYSNVINVYVSYLREKVDADAETRLIHTVRGVGYVLSERHPVRFPSLRWKLVLPIMSLAALAALLLVWWHQASSRDQLLGQLERTLATKCEEIHSVLDSGATSEELAAFLEVETRYRSSAYEYFYEISESGGAQLLTSRNLAGVCLLQDGLGSGAGLVTRSHPLQSGELVRVRSEPLTSHLTSWLAPQVSVAVSLAPFEAAVHASLVQGVTAAGVSLASLFATLWFIVGSTLRRVAAITRRASSITSTNLRERLPVMGSGDEVDELSRVFNGMLAGLERSLEQMEGFTSDAAHQLRTPLTRARGQLDLVLREGNRLSADDRGRLEETREELERLARTCSRLLLLARLDRGALEQHLLEDEVDLSSLLEDLVEQVAPAAAEQGVRVRYAGGNSVGARCSRPLLIEALLNLFDNAIRASAPGKTVEASLRLEAGQALITVADQGPGIAEHLREHVFVRFHQHDAGQGGRMGLGLSIVRGIARAHGGDVRIGTSRWGGASVELALPLARKPQVRISAGIHPILSPAP